MNTFVCFIYIFALRLASHSSLGDQNNCCADHEDGANDVEHCCTNTTSGRKFCASVVDNISRLLKICFCKSILTNSDCLIISLVVTSGNCAFFKSICASSKSNKFSYIFTIYKNSFNFNTISCPVSSTISSCASIIQFTIFQFKLSFNNILYCFSNNFTLL